MKRVSYTAAEVEALVMGALAGASAMTPEEREAQRRSFVHGTVAMSNPEVTREMVDEVVEEMPREAPAKRWVDSWWAVSVALLVLAAFFALVYSVAPNGAREHVEVPK